jgi:hypothetical protein
LEALRVMAASSRVFKKATGNQHVAGGKQGIVHCLLLAVSIHDCTLLQPWRLYFLSAPVVSNMHLKMNMRQ